MGIILVPYNVSHVLFNVPPVGLVNQHQVGQHPSRTSQTCCSMKLMKSALMGNGGGLCDMSWHSLGPGFGCDIMTSKTGKRILHFLVTQKIHPKKSIAVSIWWFFSLSIDRSLTIFSSLAWLVSPSSKLLSNCLQRYLLGKVNRGEFPCSSSWWTVTILIKTL